MKSFWSLCAIIGLMMLIIPAFGMSGDTPRNTDMYLETTDTLTTENINETTTQSEMSLSSGAFKVYMTDSNEVVTISEREYLYGVTAAEMGPSYESEALKAQAVVAYTYAVRIRERQKENPSAELKGADISDSSEFHQAYFSEEELRASWGEAFDTNYQKIKGAVDAVFGKVIIYDGEPILAAFHAISPGKTEASENVWEQHVPYLTTVTSSADMLSPEYITNVEVTAAEMKEKLSDNGAVTFPQDLSEWIGNTVRSESDTVTHITLCGRSFTGTQIRNIFSLRSSAFSLAVSGDVFTFTVFGSGHGVGMSQYGANYLAQQGATYDQIIHHYYTGVSISETTDL